MEAQTLPTTEPRPGTTVTEHRLASLMRDAPPTCRLRFRPVCDLAPTSADDWIWKGFLARGALTVLAGQPKVGKSTLLFGLLASRPSQSFLGHPVTPGQTLLLSEEREGTLSEKAETFGLQEGLHVLCRHDVHGLAWDEVVQDALLYCRLQSIDTIVVDTFDKWGNHDENSSSQVVAALQPLMVAASEGLAVVIVHHQRKAAGLYGEAIRGSNALTGGVDIVIELERSANLRVLRSVSRFIGTPPEVYANLCGNRYTTIELFDDDYELEIPSDYHSLN